MAEQIIVSGLLTNYFYFRGDNSAPVIFLHGWASSKAVWGPASVYLAEENMASYALDLPGFGQTQPPPIPWGVEDYVNFVREFMAKLNLPSAIIVGHSFGGRVGIRLAAKYPESVKKLVIVDGAGIRASANFKKFLALIAKIVKPFFRWRWTSPIRKRIYRSIGAEDYVNTPELNATFVKVIGEDLTKYLSKIQQPALIVWGRYDAVTPLAYARQFLKYLPNGRLEILDKAGHYSFLDKPEEFNRILNNFIALKP